METGNVTPLTTGKSHDPEKLRQFMHRYGFRERHQDYCSDCSTIVTHGPVAFEKTREHAIVHYEHCPKRPDREFSAHTLIPLSKKDQRKWNDLFAGLKDHMCGLPPKDFVAPVPTNLDPKLVIDLWKGDDPYVVMYPGAVPFISLLIAANLDWNDGKLDEEAPYQESDAHYLFCRKGEGEFDWEINISPASEGAELYTVVYWDADERSWQGA